MSSSPSSAATASPGVTASVAVSNAGSVASPKSHHIHHSSSPSKNKLNNLINIQPPANMIIEQATNTIADMHHHHHHHHHNHHVSIEQQKQNCKRMRLSDSTVATVATGEQAEQEDPCAPTILVHKSPKVSYFFYYYFNCLCKIIWNYFSAICYILIYNIYRTLTHISTYIRFKLFQ